MQLWLVSAVDYDESNPLGIFSTEVAALQLSSSLAQAQHNPEYLRYVVSGPFALDALPTWGVGPCPTPHTTL